MPNTWRGIKEASGSSGCLIFHTKRRLKKTCCSGQIYMQRPCQQVFNMILRIKTYFQMWKNFTVCKKVSLTHERSATIFMDMKNTIINRKFVYTYNNVTAILVAVNIAVFCLTYFLFPRLTYTLALVPSSVYYGHSYWQFVTYMFTHGSISHLLFNMLSLYIFGTAVERRVGSKEFLLYYMLTGTLCGEYQCGSPGSFRCNLCSSHAVFRALPPCRHICFRYNPGTGAAAHNTVFRYRTVLRAAVLWRDCPHDASFRSSDGASLHSHKNEAEPVERMEKVRQGNADGFFQGAEKSWSACFHPAMRSFLNEVTENHRISTWTSLHFTEHLVL